MQTEHLRKKNAFVFITAAFKISNFHSTTDFNRFEKLICNYPIIKQYGCRLSKISQNTRMGGAQAGTDAAISHYGRPVSVNAALYFLPAHTRTVCCPSIICRGKITKHLIVLIDVFGQVFWEMLVINKFLPGQF